MIIVGTFLALLVDGLSGLPDNGYDSSSCSNFTFSTTDTTYPPSEIININSSCSTTTVCPSWRFILDSVKIEVLRNDTKVTGQTCTRIMSIRVVAFPAEIKRTELLVDFMIPRNERMRVINVEKSNDGEACNFDFDCYNAGQVCSAVSRCSCPDQFVFVRNLRQCYPVVSRYYGLCTYSEQCRPSNSICKLSTCQCPDHHLPDEFFFNCLPDARGIGEECATDGNCQNRDIHSWCNWGHCACKSNYNNIFGFCQPSDYHPSGSSRIYCGWLGILLAVFLVTSNA